MSLETHLEPEIELNSEMHLEAVIEQIWRWFCRPRLSNSEMHSESGIERLWRCIRRPRSSNSELH